MVVKSVHGTQKTSAASRPSVSSSCRTRLVQPTRSTTISSGRRWALLPISTTSKPSNSSKPIIRIDCSTDSNGNALLPHERRTAGAYGPTTLEMVVAVEPAEGEVAPNRREVERRQPVEQYGGERG